MSQKKRVRVYKPGQMNNSLNSWFMQMGGMPQQPQQQDMATQVIQYAQQMIMEGEDPNNVYDLIRQWATERGIYTNGDTKTQYIKLQEESGELARAILKDNKSELIDAIGDIVVVLTNFGY